MKSRPTKAPIAILVALLVVGLLGACTSTGGSKAPAGPPPEEQVQTLVMNALSMLKEGNIEGMMANYADDFTSDQGDKAAVQGFLQGAADGGFLDGMTTNTDEMTINVDGDTAKVEGLSIEGAFGLFDLTFDLENRDGTWIIIKQTQQ